MIFPMKTVKLASLSEVSKEHNGKVIYLNASVQCSICISFPAHLIGKISTRTGKTEGRVAEG